MIEITDGAGMSTQKGTILFDKPSHLIKKDDNDISGVVKRNELLKLLEIFCTKIFSAASIFSLYDIGGNDGKPERIASHSTYILTHYCCESLRICGGNELCMQSDYDHAGLFKGKHGPIRKSEMKKCVKENISEMQKRNETKIYFNKKAPPPQYVPFKDIGYIEFLCPMLGYRELVFPIIIEDLVLGVIFCGQLLCEKDLVEGEEIRNHFLDDPGKQMHFDEYFRSRAANERDSLIATLRAGVDLYKNPDPDVTQYQIRAQDRESLINSHWVTERRRPILGPDDYSELVTGVMYDALVDFSSELHKSFKNRRINYVASVIKEESRDFYLNFFQNVEFSSEDKAEQAEDKEKTISQYWGYVENALRKIVIRLYLQDIQVYCASSPRSELEKAQRLAMVAFSSRNDCPRDLEFIKERFFYLLKESDLGSWNSSDHPFSKVAAGMKTGREYLSRIRFEENPDDDDPYNLAVYNKRTRNVDVFPYPIPDNLLHSSVIVLDYFEERDDSKLEDTEYLKIAIRMEFSLFSTMIFYVGSYLLTSLLQSNLERIMRFFKHELSHVLLGYNYLNEEFIKDFDYFKSLKPKELSDVKGDFTSTEDMMKSITSNIELLTKPQHEIVVKKTKFRIFKELLYKWEKLYRYEISQKNLKFVIPHGINLDDPQRPLIISDKRLLEMVIYNIVHNAIKYSNWGTKIHIDCEVKYKKPINKQVLSVVNYGSEIELGKRPYLLYYRKADIRQTIDGSGIGLFVVARIADILGLTVRHNCLRISEYNVALIDQYINMPFNELQKDEELVEILRKENTRLAKKKHEIVCNSAPEKPLSDLEVAEMIHMPTYKVTFEVRI